MLTVVFFSLFSCFGSLYAAIPQSLNFQTKLTDKDGLALNGNYQIKFALYDALTSGNLLWQETQTVAVEEGVANVILGNLTPLNLSFDKPYWLELVIQGEAFSQRLPLSSSAYSFNSTKLEGHNSEEFLLKTSSGNVGIGTATPVNILHVKGPSGSKSQLTLDGGSVVSTGSGQGIDFNYPGAGTIASIHHDWTSGTGVWAMRFKVWNGALNEAMTILGSGNVGIGTTLPAGKLDVNGAIYQRGSALHADYVFEPEYKLESIEEHAAFMSKNKHLKAIPKLQRDEQGQEILELGAHNRGILEELEKAHVYIKELNERIKVLEAKLGELKK